jgi:GNAT superfamily N-acetyltransferase
MTVDRWKAFSFSILLMEEKMVEIYQIKSEEARIHVRELFGEYLIWANKRLNEEYGIDFDVEAMLEQDMLDLNKFLPPQGCLLLAKIDNNVAGLACMRMIRDDIAEVKRMYVRSKFRKKGIGRSLLDQVLIEASLSGFPRVRLDSARFMKAAHSLYRSVGFEEIDPYIESEIPEEYQANWVFMEKWL